MTCEHHEIIAPDGRKACDKCGIELVDAAPVAHVLVTVMTGYVETSDQTGAGDEYFLGVFTDIDALNTTAKAFKSAHRQRRNYLKTRLVPVNGSHIEKL
jgi:hypothetical protein